MAQKGKLQIRDRFYSLFPSSVTDSLSSRGWQSTEVRGGDACAPLKWLWSLVLSLLPWVPAAQEALKEALPAFLTSHILLLQGLNHSSESQLSPVVSSW